MIKFDNWTLTETGEVIARQYDNLSRTLLVEGDLPAGYDWDLLVEAYGRGDTIRLCPMEGGVGVQLTAKMLAIAGHYTLQLRATAGEAVRHTNTIMVFIPGSLPGHDNWPELPSDFEQFERRCSEAADQAEAAAEGAGTSAAQAAAAAEGAETSAAQAETAAEGTRNDANRIAALADYIAYNTAQTEEHAEAAVQAREAAAESARTARESAYGVLEEARQTGVFNGADGEPGPQGPKGDKGDTGATGATGPQGENGRDGADYVLTDADKAEIAELVEKATILQAPRYVDSREDMTDTDRLYVLNSTGHIYAYMKRTYQFEDTIGYQVEATEDNPYQVGRLSSGGTVTSDLTGYVVTPYIDLTKPEYQGKTIQIQLDGNRYFSESTEAYIMSGIYAADKSVLVGRTYSCLDAGHLLKTLVGSSAVIHSEKSATLNVPIPATTDTGATIGYLRFCGKGTEAASDIYVFHQETSIETEWSWVDTGKIYAPSLTAEDKRGIVAEVASMIDDQLLSLLGDGVVTE